MGFWDVCKSIGKAIVEDLQERQERINRAKERYSTYDDKNLLRLYRIRNGEDKIAIGMVLRERGYGPQDED